jgi:hypothetical protein
LRPVSLNRMPRMFRQATAQIGVLSMTRSAISMARCNYGIASPYRLQSLSILASVLSWRPTSR